MKVIAADAFDTGPLQAAGAIATRSGWASAYDPFMRCPGSSTVSAASPAVLVTVAFVVAVYSRATPGVSAPKLAGGPSTSESVGGTVAADARGGLSIGSVGSSSQVIASASAFMPASLGCRWSPLS